MVIPGTASSPGSWQQFLNSAPRLVAQLVSPHARLPRLAGPVRPGCGHVWGTGTGTGTGTKKAYLTNRFVPRAP